MDSKVGGASATGLGEDVMKGCVSYEIVRLMAEGVHPQEACERAVAHFDKELKRTQGESRGYVSDCHEQQRRVGRSYQY